ncbi:unnamed protein product [Musa acuminata subsp. malaccensis]|uniref:(wild Malaysian banana) hypothetical protein n=1 Tax=Musa acuminata subsp. malaccensis TaxID=214687 RepID=A0A804L968_MUSAM|nr:unnamed protein product [Musa acuminata subsp. malaccensis]
MTASCLHRNGPGLGSSRAASCVGSQGQEPNQEAYSLQGCFVSFPDPRLFRSEYKAAVLRGKWAIIITTTITMKVLVHMMIPSWPAVAAHAFW